jgi:hypothetical protein
MVRLEIEFFQLALFKVPHYIMEPKSLNYSELCPQNPNNSRTSSPSIPSDMQNDIGHLGSPYRPGGPLFQSPPHQSPHEDSSVFVSSSSSILAFNSSGNSNPTRLAVRLILSSCSIPTEGLYRSKSVYPLISPPLPNSPQGSGLYVVGPLTSEEEQGIVALCNSSFGVGGGLLEYGAEVCMEGLVAGDGQGRVGYWLGLEVRSGS